MPVEQSTGFFLFRHALETGRKQRIHNTMAACRLQDGYGIVLIQLHQSRSDGLFAKLRVPPDLASGVVISTQLIQCLADGAFLSRRHKSFVVVSRRQLFPNGNSVVARFWDSVSPINYTNIVIIQYLQH